LGRLTIFAKGNLDLRDTLHAQRIGETLTWNGVNALLRERRPAWTARVRHETWTRSDALLEAGGQPPDEVALRAELFGAYPPPSQFSDALFSAQSDAYVLSIQPDLNTRLARHREEGYLLYPEGWRRWPAVDQAWLTASFVDSPPLDVSESMANFAAIVERLRSRSAAPILVYNVSAVTPGDTAHTYDGLEETLSTRIHRFNLALIELSRRTGVSIIDVDRVVARGGADRLKLDALHLNAAGCRLVAAEVVRVLEDQGCFEGPQT
jgi:hypothetical protein